MRLSETESAALDADVLLRAVLGLDRATLLTHPERALAADELQSFDHLIDRRAAGEPVAYLTGRREFMGLEFLVDPRALIPRPESELLVERALQLVDDDEGSEDAPPTLIDIGTGSGAIAISIAHARPRARVFASDISADALTLARENARRLLGKSQATVAFLQGSLLADLSGPVDIVCANLPYIPSGALAKLPKTVRDFEPHVALDGGPDGLECYRALLADLPSRLRPGGSVLMECDPDQTQPLGALAAHALGGQVRVHKDLAGLNRLVEARSRTGNQ